MKGFILFLIFIQKVTSHGHLADPPARSSLWYYDKNFGQCCTHYDHNQMFCGGTQIQWGVNGGKCGICGEEWRASKLFEKGGRKYVGRIVKTYKQGATIDVKIVITAPHKGWFEFRICNIDGWQTDATQECLNKTVLTFSRTKDYRYFLLEDRAMEFNLKVDLPNNLVCDHCVLQWKYRTGNSWGIDEKTNKPCLGCGDIQEHFFGCADISITPNAGNRITNTVTQRTRSIKPNSINCKPKFEYGTNDSVREYCTNVCKRYCYRRNRLFENRNIANICDNVCPAYCVCE